jgi:hypothetical protein
MMVRYLLTGCAIIFAFAGMAGGKTVILDTDGSEIGRVRDNSTITNGDFEVGKIDAEAGVVCDSAGGTGYYEEPEGRILDANRAVIAKLKDDGAIVNDVGVEVGRWRGEKDALAVAVFAFFFNRFI